MGNAFRMNDNHLCYKSILTPRDGVFIDKPLFALLILARLKVNK